MSYLRRPRLLALLLGASVLTYGIGGLVVHGLCRRQRYCAHCGVRWRTPAKNALEIPLDNAETAEERTAIAELNKHNSGLIMRGAPHVIRFLSLAMGVVGVVNATAGILAGDLAEVVDGLFRVALAGMGFVASWKMLEWLRPAAADQDDARKVLRLADRRGGILTVADISTELELDLGAAEQLMTAMDDGFRVRSDIGGDGGVRYEFPEVLNHNKPDDR